MQIPVDSLFCASDDQTHWNDKCICRKTHIQTLCLLPLGTWKMKLISIHTFVIFFCLNIGVELINGIEYWKQFVWSLYRYFEYMIGKKNNITFGIFCVTCETAQFSNKDFSSHFLEFLPSYRVFLSWVIFFPPDCFGERIIFLPPNYTVVRKRKCVSSHGREAWAHGPRSQGGM